MQTWERVGWGDDTICALSVSVQGMGNTEATVRPVSGPPGMHVFTRSPIPEASQQPSSLTHTHTHTHAHIHTHMHTHTHTLMHACTQMFNREAEQAESWIAKREAFLASEDVGSSLDAVEALIKKHEDFDKSLQAQVSPFHSYSPVVY